MGSIATNSSRGEKNSETPVSSGALLKLITV